MSATLVAYLRRDRESKEFRDKCRYRDSNGCRGNGVGGGGNSRDRSRGDLGREPPREVNRDENGGRGGGPAGGRRGPIPLKSRHEEQGEYGEITGVLLPVEGKVAKTYGDEGYLSPAVDRAA